MPSHFRVQIPVSEWTNLADIEELYRKRHDIWSTLDKWLENTNKWGSTALESLDVEAMHEEVNEAFKTAVNLHKEVHDEVVLSSLWGMIAACKCNPASPTLVIAM